MQVEMLAVAERVGIRSTQKWLNMHTGANSPNIEKKRRCAWPRKNKDSTLLRRMLKFLERIVDGRIRAVV